MSQTRPWIYYYVIVLALCVLGSIILGALLTGQMHPIPGTDAPRPTASIQTQFFLAHLHAGFSWVIAVLTLGLAISLSVEKTQLSLGWAAVGVMIIQGALGMQGANQSMASGLGTLHALLAPLLLSLLAAIGAGISKESHLKVLEDVGKPSLRLSSVVVPFLIVVQILLGATYRHNVMGVLSHIMNAMIVVIVVLVVCMAVIRQFPHPALQPAAIGLSVIIGIQLILGFATLIFLLTGAGNSSALLIISTLHVANGSLALAGSVLMMTRVRQYVKPKN